jgi:hypothetical protein
MSGVVLRREKEEFGTGWPFAAEGRVVAGFFLSF